MWSNNSFGVNGSYPNGFSQEDFLFPTASFQNTSGPLEQHFTRPQHDVLVGLETLNGQNESGFLKNSFQSEVEIFNQSTFDMNTQNSNQPVQCSPSSFSNIQTTNSSNRPTAPQISSRAAELKAQLLARRAITANPSSGKPATKSGTSMNLNGTRQEKNQQSISSSSSRQSPQNPSTTENRENELNLNDLISQYSDSKSGSDKKTDRDNRQGKSTKSKIPDPLLHKESEERKSPVSRGNSNQNLDAAAKKKSDTESNDKGCARKVDLDEPDMEPSEGEIIEEGVIAKTRDTTNSKELPSGKNVSKGDDKASRKLPTKQNKNAPPNRSPRDVSGYESQVPTPQTQRSHDSRSLEVNLRQEEKNQSLGPNTDYQQNPNSEKHCQPRNDTHSEDFHRPEAIPPNSTGDYSRQRPIPLREREREQRSTNPPILEDILAHDIDLREWLEITGYHNKPYKDKILARRRAIAALDAQKEKLIAEIEAEERGGIPVTRTQSISLSMLPPPIPSYKSSERLGTVPLASTSPLIHDRYQIAPTSKRLFSQTQDPWIENGTGKIARIEVANYNTSTKDGQSLDVRRPRSSDQDSANRYISNRLDDSSRPYNNSRDQNYSPGFLGYEHKSPTRPRVYENDVYDDDEISETGSRSFESRGNNRGRVFESKYRGRGRGRGRGDRRDSRGSPEPRSEASSCCKTANGRTSKNSRGGSRGSRGN